jgi:hypothetical protein
VSGANDASEASERKRSRRARDSERLRAAGRADVVRALAQHRTGRDFLYWLLELGHLARNPFTGNALITAFQCGQFDVAQQIQGLILETAPDGYLTMLKEQEDDRRIHDTTERSEPEPDGVSAGDDGTTSPW